MKKSDFGEFAAVWTAARSVYDRVSIDRETLGIIFHALEEYELPAVKGALTAHVKTSKFPPTPADVISLLRGSDRSRAEALASEFLGHLLEHDCSYAIVTDDDAAVTAFKSVWGTISAYGMSPSDRWTWETREFNRLYVDFDGCRADKAADDFFSLQNFYIAPGPGNFMDGRTRVSFFGDDRAFQEKVADTVIGAGKWILRLLPSQRPPAPALSRSEDCVVVEYSEEEKRANLARVRDVLSRLSKKPL